MAVANCTAERGQRRTELDEMVLNEGNLPQSLPVESYKKSITLYDAFLALIYCLQTVGAMPYAVTSHFAPAEMMQAIEIYRSTFRPSPRLAKPHVMLGFNVFAADSD